MFPAAELQHLPWHLFNMSLTCLHKAFKGRAARICRLSACYDLMIYMNVSATLHFFVQLTEYLIVQGAEDQPNKALPVIVKVLCCLRYLLYV